MIAAVVVGPNLRPRSAFPDEPAQGSVGVPTWSPDDSWTYNVTWSSGVAGSEPAASGGSVAGILTRTVAGIVPLDDGGDAYNVTVSMVLDGGMSGSFGETDYVRITGARADGYTWHRTADLAAVVDVRTIRLAGVVPSLSETHRVSLEVRIETTYDPGWDAWSFPIEENETWSVVTDATVRGESVFRLDSSDYYIEIGRDFSFTVPLNYTMTSGMVEDVGTPAGTFSAIRTFAVVPPSDVGEDLALAFGIAAIEVIPRASLDVWFSGSVGNVVRAVATVDLSTPVRLEVVLVSFRHA